MKVAVLTTDSREHFKTYEKPAPYFGTAPEALFQGFAALTELEVHIVSCLRQPVRSPEKIAPNIFYHGLHVPPYGWMRTLYQGCVRATRTRLAQIQPDLVHGQGTERDCALDAVFSGRPNVVTVHGNMVDVASTLRARPGSFLWLSAKLETLALRRTLGVFCNSAFTERLVAPRSRRHWRVPNAVRSLFFSPPANALERRAKCVLLNVGVICDYKRQLEALEIGRRLHAAGLAIELRFLGTIPPGSVYGAQFLERLRQAEKEGYASYGGFQDGEALRDEYDRAAALLHIPSSESFGLVVAEALARNLKLFSTRTGGIPDVAADVPDAELFAEGDWESIISAVTRWYRADWPRSEHGAAAIRARYHPELIARRHLEIYREVLSKVS